MRASDRLDGWSLKILTILKTPEILINSTQESLRRLRRPVERPHKNAWEPVFHFCLQPEIKFRPTAAGHVSNDCFAYSPGNPESTSGSGLLGTGPRGSAAGGLLRLGRNGIGGRKSGAADEDDGRHAGIARPSNVIEVRTETSQGSHSAPFPRSLVEFFVKAFSDAGDIVFDPFLGSGSTMAAAHVLGRAG
jgi:hypothetical protein